MKNVATILLIILIFVQPVYADTDTHENADIFFDWVERGLPDYFPATYQGSQTLDVWYYRFYPVVDNYLALNMSDLKVYVISEALGGFLSVGPLDDLLQAAGLDGPANSCRLLYDASLDEDDDYIIWHGDEDNGYRCQYDSHGDFRLSNETPYKDGEKDGLEKAYYVGTLTHEIQWLNGEQHGVSRSYHSNGNVWYETPMFHGLQDGIQKIYYQSGVLEKEIPWYQGDDFVDGIYKKYWENGNLKYETGWDENGKETGVRRQYYESGQLHNINNVVEYKFQGEGKTYYESGQLMEDEYYVDGDLHGICKYYREDGTLKDCRIYDHDSYEGSCMP